jgi:hypothetical protein
MVNGWGSDSRYYAARERKPNRASDLERRLVKLLQSYSPDAREKVQRAFKQWNLILRDYLRTETGLRLSVGDEAQSVPVKIEDGLPRPFFNILSDYERHIELLLILPRLKAAESGLEEAVENYDALVLVITTQREPGDAVAMLEEVITVRKFVSDAVGKLQKLELLKKFGQIEEDTLGAYFYRLPEVQLYWMPIAFIAALLSVPVEALAVVVLAHELAHAYTHLGRDIDSNRWEVEKFADADLFIVEGMAQFYTSVICKKLEMRYPAAMEAFDKLLAQQSGPYRAHEVWAKDHHARGEVVRACLIKCRSHGFLEYLELKDEMRSTEKELARSEGDRP